MPFLEEQLNFLHFLQAHRGSFMEFLLRIFNFFDTSTFITYLVIFIWIGFSWRWGVRLASLMVVSGVVNYLAKLIFELPRPEFYDATLPLVHVPGYGFPSGGAQNGFLLGGLLILYWKNRWAWPLSAAFAISVAFSRIYLGVHFPLDVLGGIAIALLLLFAFVKGIEPLERLASRHPLAIFLTIFLLSSILFFGPLRLQNFSLVAMVVSLGIYLSVRYGLYLEVPENLKINLSLGAFGVFSSMLLGFFASNLFFYTLVIGLWVTLLVSPVCKKLFHKILE